jgi:hypothetical protein
MTTQEILTEITNNIMGLPLYLVLGFGFGYIGYWIAYNKANVQHSNYKVLLFSIFSIYLLYDNLSILNILFALIGSIILGVFFKLIGRNLLFKALRFLRISNDTGWNSVLNEFEHNTYIVRSSMIVTTLDGYIYTSHLNDYEGEHLGPYRIDDNGNILMYIDEIDEINSNETDEVSPYISNDGDVFIRYIPKEQIKRIDFKITSKRKN